MRKISKSRADDDVISSTNGSGSVGNNEEHQQESETVTDENEKDPIDVADEKVNSDSESSQTLQKTPKGKAKGKKRKSERASKKVAVEEKDEEYEVEKVIDSKKIKGKLHYLIRWKGYTADSDTWEPENTLSCPELINKFNESQKENSKGKANNSPKKRKLAPKSKVRKEVAKKVRKSDTDDETEDENAEYEVDRILEVHHKKNGEREFYIHWKGWSNKYDSWEPESNLNCPELIKKFMSKVSAARSTGSRNLRVAPETTNRFTLQDPAGGRRLSKRRGQRQRVRYDNAE